MNTYQEAVRYINCNLPDNSSYELKDNKPLRIEVYFNKSDKPEFIFYLEDYGDFKCGDMARDNPSLGYYKNHKDGSFLSYDYEAARKWDIENAGCKLSPSY